MSKETVWNRRINTNDGISKSNRTNTKLLITTSIVLSMFLVLLGTASAVGTAPPNKFSGNVTLNDVNASIGTVISAYIGGELRGNVTTGTAGKYAQLPVNGNESDEGAEITFKVCGATADQNATWGEYARPQIRNLTAVDNEAPVVSSPCANPASVAPAGAASTQLNVTVIDGCSCNIDSVTVDLSTIGGSDAQVMTRINDTDVYSVAATVAEGTAIDTYCLPVNACDVFGNYNDGVCIDLVVTMDAGLPKDGDINGNGAVTLADAIYLTKHVAGMSGYETLSADGDINGNDAVTLADAIYLAKHVAGMSGYETLY